MENYDFSSILQADSHYILRKCIRQHWSDTRFRYNPNARPDCGIMYLLKGHIRFEFAGGQLTADPGDLVFLPAGCCYDACIPADSVDTEDYLINFDILPLSHPLPEHPVALLQGGFPGISSLFAQIVENQTGHRHTGFYDIGQFCLLLDMILSELSAAADRHKPYLRQAKMLLDSEKDLSVARIARLCGISESGLRSQFHSAYGMSPSQYRMHTRMEKARYLLEATDLSVYAIAEQLGFYDVAYFCKMFRKYTGCSPRQYAAGKSI